ncbi:MAG: hypothetical protein ACFFCW_49230 [Candidatus Hodarchaeota archaeon]
MAYSTKQWQLLNWGTLHGLTVKNKKSVTPQNLLRYWVEANNHTVEVGRIKDNKIMKEVITVEDVVAMLQRAVTSHIEFIKAFCIRQGKRMAQDLKKHYRYMGVLKRKISDALGEVNELSLSQRQEAFKLVEEFLT